LWLARPDRTCPASRIDPVRGLLVGPAPGGVAAPTRASVEVSVAPERLRHAVALLEAGAQLLEEDPPASSRPSPTPQPDLRTCPVTSGVPDDRGTAVQHYQSLPSGDVRCRPHRQVTAATLITVWERAVEVTVAPYRLVRVAALAVAPGSLPMTFGELHRRTRGLPRLLEVPWRLGSRPRYADLPCYPHPFP